MDMRFIRKFLFSRHLWTHVLVTFEKKAFLRKSHTFYVKKKILKFENAVALHAVINSLKCTNANDYNESFLLQCFSFSF